MMRISRRLVTIFLWSLFGLGIVFFLRPQPVLADQNCVKEEYTETDGLAKYKVKCYFNGSGKKVESSWILNFGSDLLPKKEEITSFKITRYSIDDKGNIRVGSTDGSLFKSEELTDDGCKNDTVRHGDFNKDLTEAVKGFGGSSLPIYFKVEEGCGGGIGVNVYFEVEKNILHPDFTISSAISKCVGGGVPVNVIQWQPKRESTTYHIYRNDRQIASFKYKPPSGYYMGRYIQLPYYSYDDRDVLPGVEYSYRVLAEDTGSHKFSSNSPKVLTVSGCGNSNPPAPSPFTVGVNPVCNSLSARISYRFKTHGDSTITYAVYRNREKINEIKNIGSIGELYYFDTNVSPGSTYTYKVVATNAAGSSEAQATAFLEPCNNLFDVLPECNSVTSKPVNRYAFFTNSVSTYTYKVYRDSFKINEIKGTDTGTTKELSYFDTNVIPGSTHTYKLEVTDDSGSLRNVQEAYPITTKQTEDCSTTPPVNPPGVFELKVTTMCNYATVPVNKYNFNTHGDSTITYTVYRNGEKINEIKNIGSIGELYYFDTNVSPGSTYTYKVVATNAAGSSEAQAVVTTKQTEDCSTTPPVNPPSAKANIFGNVFGANDISGVRVDEKSIVAAKGNISVDGESQKLNNYSYGSADNAWNQFEEATNNTLEALKKEQGCLLQGISSISGTFNLNPYQTCNYSSSKVNVSRSEGTVWYVDGNLKINTPIEFVGRGTFVISGNVTVAGGGKGITYKDVSTSLGVIVKGGNVTLNDVPVRGAWYAPKAYLTFSGNSKVIARGLFAAKKVDISNANISVKYDSSIAKLPPPGFNSLSLPVLGETTP